MKTKYRTAALALAALSCVAGVLAQTSKAREATLGGGTGSGPTLSRDQLRDCLVEQDALKTTREGLARDQQAVDAEKAELARAGTELKARLDALDRTSADAVNAHVEQAKAHDARVDAWNAKLPAFNERVVALGKRNDEWKGQCADRRYKEDDLILLQARKQVPAGAR